MSFSIQITLNGEKVLADTLQRIQRATADMTELNGRFGIQLLNWVDRQFKSEGGQGGAPWAKLAASTIAGRRRGSSRILQDTGLLKNSFTERHTSEEVRVGTAVQYASFHQTGTRPYTIRPKNAKALAFPAATGGTKVGASFSSRTTGKTYKKGQALVIVKSVNHPGLKARPLLPTREQILPILLNTAQNYLNEVLGRGPQKL